MAEKRKLENIRLLLAVVHDINLFSSVVYAYIIGHLTMDKIRSFRFESKLQEKMLLPVFRE